MGLVRKFFQNTRKPLGFLGKLMVRGMNAEHAKVADWGLAHLRVPEPGNIVELGCGGGRNAARLLEKYPRASLAALDHSPVSVEETRRLNAAAVASGRCAVVEGNVAGMPFPDGSFDLATAFETVYFWPGPAESFREVRRVLAPGGTFMIVNESDGTRKGDARWKALIDGLEFYGAEELTDLLRGAGFGEIAVDRDESRGWLCLLCRKGTEPAETAQVQRSVQG